jgi:hypothetical protein
MKWIIDEKDVKVSIDCESRVLIQSPRYGLHIEYINDDQMICTLQAGDLPTSLLPQWSLTEIEKDWLQKLYFDLSGDIKFDLTGWQCDIENHRVRTWFNLIVGSVLKNRSSVL